MKLTSVRVRHFKAVEDSGTIKLGPLTAFVGYNGTGKSSVIEACEFFQAYALKGIEAALTPWFKFDHVLWQGADRKKDSRGSFLTRPVEIELAGMVPKFAWRTALEIGELAESVGRHQAKTVVAKREFLKVGKLEKEFRFDVQERGRPREGGQIFNQDRAIDFRQWMFLSLNPHEIGQPRRRPESRAEESLVKTGANLADILKSFLDLDRPGFDAMIEALQYIVPYAANVRSDITKDLVETRSLIQLTEHFRSGRDTTLPGCARRKGGLGETRACPRMRHRRTRRTRPDLGTRNVADRRSPCRERPSLDRYAQVQVQVRFTLE